jgi:predicted phosphodiesterase
MNRTVRPGLFLLLLLLTGAANAQSQKWKFLVYGDTRGTNNTSDQINATILAELARATTNTSPKPEFVLVPGDLVNSGTLSAFQSWTNIMAPVYAAGIKVYPVIGNHDTASVSGYTTVFGADIPDNGPASELNRTYYVIQYNVLVAVMDNYVVAHQCNTNWLKNVLQTNRYLHAFVMGHEPAFSVNHTDCLDDVPGARDVFWNILSNAACRVYFCGHDHFYDHMRLDDEDGDPSNDVHQTIVGTGGAPFHADSAYDGTNSIWTPTRIRHDMTYGYVAVEIDGPIATLTWYQRTAPNNYAATSDVFTYSLAPVIASTYSNGALTLTWSGGGRLQSASGPTGQWTTLANGTSPYAVTGLSGSGTFYRVQLRP